MTKYRCFGCYKTTGKLCAPHAANKDKMEVIDECYLQSSGQSSSSDSTNSVDGSLEVDIER